VILVHDINMQHAVLGHIEMLIPQRVEMLTLVGGKCKRTSHIMTVTK